METHQDRKARGAYFTPAAVSQYIADWAITSVDDRILEPSCGEAAFLLAAGYRLRTLGGDPAKSGQVQGIDLHAASVERARRLVRGAGVCAEITARDFFDFDTDDRFDAIIGNPPYVRYQGFTGEARARSRKAALAGGVPLTALASSWAGFVVHAARFLRPGGRLGLVLPAELLSVNYAAEVRRFLLRRFERVRLVMFEEHVFPGVMEEVVLLLAEGTGPTDHFEVFPILNLDELPPHAAAAPIVSKAEAGEKWVRALIAADATVLYERLTGDHERFVPLIEWGDPTLGMVTGNNKWFALTTEEAAELGLEQDELLPISPPGSRHLRRLAFDKGDWSRMADAGERVYLFRPAGEPSLAARMRVTAGETMGVNQAYKCRVRKPWWRVPLVAVPDLFLTYMNADAPRLVANVARVRYLNSVHGLVLKEDRRGLGMELLPIGMLNSASLLGAELVGRSYGGGILKIEPKEADQLPVPTPGTLASVSSALLALRDEVAALLAQGRLDDAVVLVDQVVLIDHAGLRHDQLDHLRRARARLRERRTMRAATRYRSDQAQLARLPTRSVQVVESP